MTEHTKHHRRTKAQIENDRQRTERQAEYERISAASPTWDEWVANQRRADSKATEDQS